MRIDGTCSESVTHYDGLHNTQIWQLVNRNEYERVDVAYKRTRSYSEQVTKSKLEETNGL